MSGHLNGVQAQVQQDYPYAQFVHCAAHRLNLVLCQAASSISPVKIFFVNISAFCTFTSNSSKRKALLSSHRLEFPSPGDTRWYYRAHVINVLHSNYEKLIDIFENLTDYPIGWDDETLSKTTGLLGYLNGFLFCFLVHVFQRILEQSSILYSILQDKDADFHYGMSRFERFKAFVASLRNDTEYCQVYDLAVEKVGPPVTRVFKMWKGEVPSEKINLLKEVYGDMFEIPMLFHLQSSIPEVVTLLKINGVLSITSASVERSFSCLKRVKNYHRNTMSQGRFSSLCRISIHKDILLEKEDANTLHDEVVKKFIEKPRRLAFLYK
ncbi:uncharacterized protein LOC124450449 isoform X2 [Xenia sp. Carnegie-2017]|uniref:uncharacterized protein LOC124450449 isoform X2 n=1 Tax=Xenia sp. Carnegie-2017 TaxID=2897299 RepID=UPI001F04578C|nr:uncharacterized protein LOC124450449 isoform X2 [Xenia sp. Carnegie-2017]